MENIKITKEYKLDGETVRKGCTAYQKKFVYPRSYLLTVIFLILAANFVYGAVMAPDSYLAYLFIMICLALAFREWYNPRKLRSRIVEAFTADQDTTYRLEIGDSEISFSTLPYEESDEADENIDEAENEPPTEENENAADEEAAEEYEEEEIKATILPIDDRLTIMEKEELFLFIQDKSVYYIVPKNIFTEEELEIVRSSEFGVRS